MVCHKCGKDTDNPTGQCPNSEDIPKSKNKMVTPHFMADDKAFYAHSGKVSAQVIFGFPLVMLIVVILSFIYSYAILYLPFVGYLSLILTVIFSVGIGYASAVILQFFKTRNAIFALIFGFFIGIFALYSAWVAFEYVLFGNFFEEEVHLSRLASHPLGVWEGAKIIAERGWYQIGNIRPKGTTLWVLWAIEAFLIIFLITYMCYVFIHDAIFCESCQGWTQDHEDTLTFRNGNEKDLVSKIVAQDLSFLDEISEVRHDDIEYYRIDFSMCCSCKELYTLSLIKINRSWKKDGKERIKEKALLENLFISEDTFDKLTGKLN